MLKRVPRGVKFLGATVHPVHGTSPSHRTVSVRLEREGEHVVGRSGNGQAGAELRRSAEAALDALGQVVGKNVTLVLRGVAPMVALGQSFVLAVVELEKDGHATTLLGVCRSSLDRARDGALAVLDAVNRYLGAS